MKNFIVSVVYYNKIKPGRSYAVLYNVTASDGLEARTKVERIIRKNFSEPYIVAGEDHPSSDAFREIYEGKNVDEITKI